MSERLSPWDRFQGGWQGLNEDWTLLSWPSKLVCDLSCDTTACHPTSPTPTSISRQLAAPQKPRACSAGEAGSTCLLQEDKVYERTVHRPHMGRGSHMRGAGVGHSKRGLAGSPAPEMPGQVGQQPGWAPASPATQLGSPQDGQGRPGEAWGGPEIVLSGCVPEKGL